VICFAAIGERSYYAIGFHLYTRLVTRPGPISPNRSVFVSQLKITGWHRLKVTDETILTKFRDDRNGESPDECVVKWVRSDIDSSVAESIGVRVDTVVLPSAPSNDFSDCNLAGVFVLCVQFLGHSSNVRTRLAIGCVERVGSVQRQVANIGL